MLTQLVRGFMLAEFDVDASRGLLLLPELLGVRGRDRYPVLLREALARHDDAWLADRLMSAGLLRSRVRPPAAEAGWRRVTAHDARLLALRDLAWYHARAACALALQVGVRQLELASLARPRAPRVPAPEPIEPRSLLDRLRSGLRLRDLFPTLPEHEPGLTVTLAEALPAAGATARPPSLGASTAGARTSGPLATAASD